MLGLRRRAYIAIENDPDAQPVPKHHYPEMVLFTDIRGVSLTQLLTASVSFGALWGWARETAWLLLEKEDSIKVELKKPRPRPLEQLFDAGWGVTEFETLYTPTKHVPVKKARWHTPGDNTADEETLER